MPTYLRWFNTLFILAVLVGGTVAYGMWREARSRNFHVVEDGVLYRSGQLSHSGFVRVMHDYNIRTVICLRDGDKDDDKTEETYCRKWGINHVRLPAKEWWAPKGPPPAEANLKKFRAVMSNPANHPVLIHCFAGVHRTGAFCAVYRMDFQDWSNAQAMDEIRNLGYDLLDEHKDLLTFLERYRSPVAEEKEMVRPVSRKR